jgi:hypothetical protein
MPNFDPHMPEVEVVPDIAERFAAARQAVVGGIEPLPGHDADQRYVVLLTPGRMLMEQPCPQPGSIPPAMIADIEAIVPSSPPLNISVIALNEIQAILTDGAKTIPFFGYLLGMCYGGHNVLIFEGHSSAFAEGVADADLLIVDSGMISFLQKTWIKDAFAAGPLQHILIFGRDGRIDEINRPT